MADAKTKIILTAEDKTRAAFQSATNNIKGMERSASNLRGSLAGIAGGVTVGAFAAFAKHTLDAADALNDMSQRTQVSVKDLASLRTVSEQSGTSLEDVGKAIAKLNLSFSQAQGGSKEVNAAMQRLGINSTDARERFFQLADAYAKASDKTRVLADIQKVLGKSYAEMIPLLSQGGDELRRAAQASESFADAMARLAPDADKFNDQLADIKTSAAGAAANILTQMLPALNEITGAMAEAAREGGLLKALWVGLGGLGAATFTNQFEDAEKRLERLRTLIERNRAQLAPGVNDSHIKALEREAAALQQIVDAQKAAQQAASASGKNKTAPGKVDLAGTSAGSKADPLASFLKSTDTARLKEYNTLVADLLQRMSRSNGDTTVFVQALDEINKKFADLVVAKDQFDLVGGIMGDWEDLQSLQDAINDANAASAEFRAEMEAAGRAIEEEFGNQADQLADRLSYLEMLLDSGAISWEAYSNAVLAAQEAFDKTGEAAGAAKDKSENFAAQISIVFGNAIDDAARAGADFDQVFKAMVADIVALIAKLLILRPLLEGLGIGMDGQSSSNASFAAPVADFFKNIGSGISGFFGFANGGVMTSAGPMPLQKFAMGGVATSPMVAMIGEGDMNEAFVPLPDGRRIPVAMQGGGRQVVNNIHITANDPSEVRLSRGARLADITRALQHANRWS